MRYTMRTRFAWVTLMLTLALAAASSAAERGFTRAALVGVWEPIAFENLAPRGAQDPATKPNSKFCFSADTAYPSLGADQRGDGADGGGPYFLVDGDILVIRTGVPGGIWTYVIVSITSDRLVLQESLLRVTFRRVAKTWDPARAPRVPPKNIPVTYAR